jgi:starvation-inducible DNA-binding protein
MENKTTAKVAKALNLVLADSYALMAQTHFCHWNVEGPGFFALHNAFEEQYTELFTAIDVIAERVRALGKGQYAEGGLANLAKLSGISELSLPADDKAMVTALVKANEKLVKDAAKARDLAGSAGDSETEDLMIGRIAVHEKTLWMLRSYLR